MFNLENERLSFIKKHSKEIVPITSESESLKVIDEAADFETIPQVSPDKVEHILEEFETKVFVMEKPAAQSDQKKVLLEAGAPGAYAAIKPIIAALQKDERCGVIMSLTSGVATPYFQRDFGNDFSQIREKDKPVLADILEAVEKRPVDVALATLSMKNAPESLVLYGSKGNLGAKKLFLVLESWGQRLPDALSQNRHNLEKIDGIFCNDGLAKEIIKKDFPDFPPELIYSFGTPILDSLDSKHSDDYRKSFREKLGIDKKATVLAYFGGISWEAKDWYGACDDVDERTFQDTLWQVTQLAKSNPDRNFVFAFRPHPRDPIREEKYKIAKSAVLPPNLSFKDAALPIFSNEVSYGADIILSTFSTENFLAPLRGRKSIFLGFSGKGMGRDLLENVYGKAAVKTLRQSEAVRVADSPESLKNNLTTLINAQTLRESAKIETNATKRILDIVLG